MKKFLKFVLVGFMFMLSGCSGSSSYSDLSIMDGVEIDVEEYRIAFRSGFESIPKHQYEAAKIFGSSYFQTIKDVIFLQVIKRILSPISNEIMTLVKDTSLARIITYHEIIFAAQRYVKTAGLIWPLFYTGIYYLVFCGLLTILFQYFEKN